MRHIKRRSIRRLIGRGSSLFLASAAGSSCLSWHLLLFLFFFVGAELFALGHGFGDVLAVGFLFQVFRNIINCVLPVLELFIFLFFLGSGGLVCRGSLGRHRLLSRVRINGRICSCGNRFINSGVIFLISSIFAFSGGSSLLLFALLFIFNDSGALIVVLAISIIVLLRNAIRSKECGKTRLLGPFFGEFLLRHVFALFLELFNLFLLGAFLQVGCLF